MTSEAHVTLEGTKYIVLSCAEIDSKNLRNGIVEGLRHMSGQSRWLRFASAVTKLSETQLDYLTDLDGSNRVAWCAAAITGVNPGGIGLARYVRLRDEPAVAEFAVSIVDEFQGQGIGFTLLKSLCNSARSNGIRTLRGYVLPQNKRMLRLAQHLQAAIHEEDDVLRVDILTDDRTAS